MPILNPQGIASILPRPQRQSHLTLRAKYDDAFIAHVNGSEVARRNFDGDATWNSGAPQGRVESETTVFESIELGSAIAGLTPGENVLAIQVLNYGSTSSDLLFVPELIAELEAGSAYARWFREIPGSDGLDDSPELDLDLDGLTNLLEFAFGGNPLQAQAATLTPLIVEQQLTFRRRIDHVADGLVYSIETSNSLAETSWRPFAASVDSISASGEPGIELITVNLPPGTGRTFYRLRATLEASH